MPTNTMVANALQLQAVPPDRECNIATLSQILQGAVDFLTIASQTQQINDGSSTANSIAQQALQVANLALSTAQAAVAAIPQTRSDVAIALPTGDSTIALSWSDALPDLNYVILGTYIGDTTNVGTYFNFRILTGTKTVNGCQLRFENTPANYSFQYLVQAIRTS